MTNSNHLSIKNIYLFYILAVISMIGIYCISPITQSLTYHLFAEQRVFAHIPHIGDVISNLAFSITGLALLLYNYKKNKNCIYYCQNHLFYFFVFSCFLLSAGSAYYHYNPNNKTLVVDRLTMICGFAVIFFDTCIRYHVIEKTHVFSKFSFVLTLFLLSVFYWVCSKHLEPYVFVQFFTMFVIVILAIYNRKVINGKHLFTMALWYFIAKICEYEDHTIYNFTNFISGHTLKHLAYAISLYYFGKGMINQKSVVENT